MCTFSKIKKQNGESFAKVIRDYHNGILEVPDIVDVVKFAGNTAEDAELNLKYFVSLINKDIKEEDDVTEDPFVLLERAGYNAYVADSLEKQDSIKKYFKQGEKLCTFGTDRFKSYYIINAIKKNVDEIRREDFNGKESRQDEYGTSVLSIQVAKKGGFISIKNRYNHTVPNCDNTFQSNPDNIIPGLSKSIQKYFGVSFSTKSNNLAEGYMLAGRKVFKVNQEINGIFYGDFAYLKNGEIIEVKKSDHEYLFDYYIFNAKEKMFRLIDSSIEDSFPADFNRDYGGLKSLYVKNYQIYDGDTLLIG